MAVLPSILIRITTGHHNSGNFFPFSLPFQIMSLVGKISLRTRFGQGLQSSPSSIMIIRLMFFITLKLDKFMGGFDEKNGDRAFFCLVFHHVYLC